MTAHGRALRDWLGKGFVTDTQRAVELATLSGPCGNTFRNKNLLLTLPRQLDMIAALIALDGCARRVVIWPENIPPDPATEAAIRRAAEIDLTVTAWPPARQPAKGAPEPVDATEWILFTSGTTGRPKLVVHTLTTLAGHIAPPADGAGPVWASFYDVRRYGGMQVLLRALVGSGSLVLSDPDERPADFLRRAGRHEASHFLGTPSHWRRALMSEAADTIRPAYVRLSGEIVDQAILDRLRAAYPGARIVHAFASTEAGLACEVEDGLAGLPANLVTHDGPFADLELREGRLFVSSTRQALGYLDGRLLPLRGEGGFVDTGDRLVRAGSRYRFAGRDDGVINVGGQKIHPEEVELVLNAHPAVAMCAVRARRNPVTGAVVSAEIVPRDGAEMPDPSSLHAFCRAHLPAHKVPATIRIVPALDLAASGKLVRARA